MISNSSSSRSRRRPSAPRPASDGGTDALAERHGLDARTVRAATRALVVYDPDGGPTIVYNEEGKGHAVRPNAGACGCPDSYHRDVDCYHLRRVQMERGERAIPELPLHHLDVELRRLLEEAGDRDD